MVEAQIMLKELEDQQLQVVLVPAPDPRHLHHMIRQAESHNPAWYSDLYHLLPHWRRDRTWRSLRRLTRAQDKPSTIIPPQKNLYDAVYRGLVRERLTGGYETVEGYEIPPCEEAVRYFGGGER